MATKICPICKIEKDVYEFGFVGIYVRTECKLCKNKKHKEYMTPDRAKAKALKEKYRKYNITATDYENLFKSQHGKCAICSRSDMDLVVDHCHKTNKVRGLLCTPCNNGIGMFRDNQFLLESAIDYLDREEAPPDDSGSQITC